MRNKIKSIYISIISYFLIFANSFGMMLEDNFDPRSAYSKSSFVHKSHDLIYDFMLSSQTSYKKEDIDYDKELVHMHGKNKSSFPISEKMYTFIISKVGENNKRPFIFKTGPQVLFDDETNLIK